MRVKATLPLRVDIGGGVTDIPQIGAQIGTSIANLAIDLFEDESCQSKTSISAEAYYNKGRNRLFFSEVEIGSHTSSDEYAFLRMMFASFLKKSQITQGVTLRISDTLPKGTGLGASAALSLCVLASLYKLKGIDEVLNADKLIKDAHYFETTEQGIQGGFQDYIAAYFGGYNYINFASLENTQLSDLSELGQRAPSAVEEFLNENMIFVIQRSENISSSIIVEDEVSNFLHNSQLVAPHLQSIKNSNDVINGVFADPISADWQDKLAYEINSSWEAQKRLSTLVGGGYVKELEEMVRPFVYAQRGPGAGGNSLFLLTNPSRKAELIQKLNTLKNKTVVLYGRVNNQGLELSIS